MVNVSRSRARQGNVVIILALSGVVLLGFAALTVDIGYGRLVQQQLQNASEASALGASLRLDATDAGVTAARATALAVAAQNTAGGAPVVLADSDIVFGVWDDVAGTFTVSTDAAEIDTIQVRAQIDDLALFLAPAAFAQETMAVGAQTRARAMTKGAGAVNCFLPLAIPSCLVEREGINGIMALTIKLNPDGKDNVGWGRPNGTPNADWSKSQIAKCEAGGEAEVGDPVGLQNGAVASAIDEFAGAIENSKTKWDPDKWGPLPPTQMPGSSVQKKYYGQTFEGPIMVVDAPPEYCTTGGSFTGSLPLKGFMWAAVFDAKKTGNVEEKNILLRVDTSEYYNFGTRGGGEDYGVVSTRPVMVRN